jgi:hypothetical protein
MCLWIEVLCEKYVNSGESIPQRRLLQLLTANVLYVILLTQ